MPLLYISKLNCSLIVPYQDTMYLYNKMTTVVLKTFSGDLFLQVFNYYVAAGLHSQGVQAAGGVGKYISELMVDGYASLANLWRCDIKRFVPHHSNRKYLKERVKETIGNNRGNN